LFTFFWTEAVPPLAVDFLLDLLFGLLTEFELDFLKLLKLAFEASG